MQKGERRERKREKKKRWVVEISVWSMENVVLFFLEGIDRGEEV